MRNLIEKNINDNKTVNFKTIQLLRKVFFSSKKLIMNFKSYERMNKIRTNISYLLIQNIFDFQRNFWLDTP